MKTEYKRTPQSSHMIIMLSECPSLYDVRMIEENNIDGLLSLSVIRGSGETEFWYDISDKRSLKTYLNQEGINKKSISVILEGLDKVCGEMENYLLNSDRLFLSPESIFISRREEAVGINLAYVPGYDCSFLEGMISIMEYLIRGVDHSDTESCAICYQLYESVKKDDFSLRGLCDICIKEKDNIFENNFLDNTLENIDSSDIETEFEEYVYEEDIQLSGFWENLKGRLGATFSNKKYKNPVEIMEKKKNRIMGEPIRQEDFIVEPQSIQRYEAETTLLSISEGYGAGLFYEGSGNFESFMIERDVFKVGSKEGAVDGLIKDASVSRVHALITKEGEDYFLEDLESKNGTYINEKILGMGTRVRLRNGDRIRFSSVRYFFRDGSN